MSNGSELELKSHLQTFQRLRNSPSTPDGRVLDGDGGGGMGWVGGLVTWTDPQRSVPYGNKTAKATAVKYPLPNKSRLIWQHRKVCMRNLK